MSDNFVDSPMPSEFNKQGKIPEGSSGIYDRSKVPPASEYVRTPSPNSVREKFFEGSLGDVKPSGEKDQF